MSSTNRTASTPLSIRFLVYYAITYLLLIGALGWFVDRQVREALVDDLVDALENSASVARESLPGSEGDLGAWADSIFAAGGYRVTVIDTDGVVIADSHSDPAAMENHATRPEVAAALAGQVGRDSRTSLSTGFAQHYLAVPAEDNLVLRLSLSERSVAERLSPVRSRILTVSIVVGLIGVVIVAVLARRMARPIEWLTATTRGIASGDLERRPARSSVRELDQLAEAITQLAEDLGDRLAQTESASETLEVVLGALPQGTVLIGPTDQVLYANPAANRLLGAIPEFVVGLDPHRLQAAIRDARESQHAVDVIVDHGSPTRRLRGVATPFSNDPRILLTVIDVTDRERVASIRRDFVANASHELKTPVASIISSSEAIRIALDRDPHAVRRFAGHIETSARQLDRLVSDLLDLSRLESETPGQDPVRIDLVLVEEVRRIAGEAEDAGVSLTVDSEACVVAGSHRDLSIAMRNLLENAVRYTAEGGSVSASARVVADEAVVEVVDNGSGIPSRDLDRVFERFYRVDNARSRQTGGTGLGLSIVKHTVESHGGAVEAESELGVGSTFRVRIPHTSSGDSV